MARIPDGCCRGGDADRIERLLNAHKQLSIGVIAPSIGRGVAYVHSIVREDERFTTITYSRHVGQMMVVLTAAAQQEAGD